MDSTLINNYVITDSSEITNIDNTLLVHREYILCQLWFSSQIIYCSHTIFAVSCSVHDTHS